MQKTEKEESSSVQIEVEDEEFLKKRQDEMEKQLNDIMRLLNDKTEK